MLPSDLTDKGGETYTFYNELPLTMPCHIKNGHTSFAVDGGWFILQFCWNSDSNASSFCCSLGLEGW